MQVIAASAGPEERQRPPLAPAPTPTPARINPAQGPATLSPPVALSSRIPPPLSLSLSGHFSAPSTPPLQFASRNDSDLASTFDVAKKLKTSQIQLKR